MNRGGRRAWMASLAALGLAGSVRPAAAGPVLDWLRERRAERSEGDDDGTEDSAGASGYAPPAGIRVDRDLAYGPDPAHRLDLYRPAQTSKAPIAVMVHGGGWRRGDKGGRGMVGNKVEHWVARGWIFVSINYRLVPAANPVEQAEDVGRALAFVQSQAPTWGGDPARCVLMGHSAGAHLVALVSADADLAYRSGAQPWRATVAIDSAALDVVSIMNRRHFSLYDKAFGSDPQFWQQASPLHRLKKKPPASLLLVCSSKRDDSCGPAQQFADKVVSLGGTARVLPVELNHAKINSDLGAQGGYTQRVDEFLKSAGVD
jgi:arylformamidase